MSWQDAQRVKTWLSQDRGLSREGLDGVQVQQWALPVNVGTHLWGGAGVSLS